jgi:hypothetical protein
LVEITFNEAEVISLNFFLLSCVKEKKKKKKKPYISQSVIIIIIIIHASKNFGPLKIKFKDTRPNIIHSNSHVKDSGLGQPTNKNKTIRCS